jgi:hypothetical protein
MRSPLRSRTVALLGAAALVLVFAYGAASANADSIGEVVKGPDSSNPDNHVGWVVQATLSGNTVTVTNPQLNEGLVFSEANGDQGVITSVDLNGPGGYEGNGGNGGNGLTANGAFTHTGPFTVHSPSSINECSIMDYINAVCYFANYTGGNASGGLYPGQSATITYPTNKPGYLWSVSVNFDYDDLYPNCRPSGYGDDLVIRSDFTQLGSAASANNCLPPSNVRITGMKINTRKHTASFHQTAVDARKFGCELFRNGRGMADSFCGAKTVYAHRLPSGRYVYQVWGVNKSGVSRDFAVARFTLR